MKILKQVCHRDSPSCPEGYYFRIKLPVAVFTSDETWESPEDAGFFADVFKSVLVRRYGLSGNTMFPSLSPERFSDLLAEAGIDRTSLDNLTDALPQSCKDFLLDGGHDELTKHKETRPAMLRVIS